MENTSTQTSLPDPLERLGAALIQQLGGAWVPDTRPDDRAVTLVHTVTDRRIGADPYEGRIILQAWTKGTTAFTPTASYTPGVTGYEDLAHWLAAGDLTAASAAMAAEIHRLLATPDGDGYVSEQRARIAEMAARPTQLTAEDARWLLDRAAWADWHLEELRDRIDTAGSMMNTSYVCSAIDYTRWSRATPEGPVTANASRADNPHSPAGARR